MATRWMTSLILVHVATCLVGAGYVIKGSVDMKGMGGITAKLNVNLHVTSDGETGGGETGEVVTGGGKVPGGPCEPMKTLLANFVMNPDWETVKSFLKHIRYIRYDVDEIWTWVNRSVGVNLLDGVTRDRIACLVYKAASGDKAAEMELSPIFTSYGYTMYYEYAMKPLITSVGYDQLLMMGDIIIEYADWLDETGYPDVTSMEVGSRQDIIDRFTDWQRRAGTETRDFTGLLKHMVFPVYQDPEKVADLMLNATSTKSLLTELGFSHSDYEVFRKSITPLQIQASTRLFTSFLLILQEFSRLGMITP